MEAEEVSNSGTLSMRRSHMVDGKAGRKVSIDEHQTRETGKGESERFEAWIERQILLEVEVSASRENGIFGSG